MKKIKDSRMRWGCIKCTLTDIKILPNLVTEKAKLQGFKCGCTSGTDAGSEF